MSFFIHGRSESVPLNELPDTNGRLSRLGVCLKAEVDALGRVYNESKIKKSMIVEKEVKSYRLLVSRGELSSNLLGRLLRRDKCTRVKYECWVSDFFGIAVGISVK